MDHSIKISQLFIQPEPVIKRRILGPSVVGIMRRIGRDPTKEWLVRTLLPHPLDRFSKKDVRAVTLRFFESTIMEDRWIEIAVPWSITATSRIRLADASCAVNKDLFESAAIRLVRLLVSQMPFAKDPCRISGSSQHLCHRHRIERQSLPFENGVRYPIEELVAPCHQRRAGRGAGGRNKKIGERTTLSLQAIQVGGLQNRIAVCGYIPVPLIIREHHDDVRLVLVDSCLRAPPR